MPYANTELLANFYYIFSPMKKLDKIGLGGGCHWCTEAVFQSLKGVHLVEQGYIASEGIAASFSEAVIVHYNPDTVSYTHLTLPTICSV